MKPSVGIVADGSCLGNPGTGSYRCVDLETGKIVYQSPQFQDTTNNVMEFAALVRALSIQVNRGSQDPVYSDSQTARVWVKNGRCNSEHPLTPTVAEMIDNAIAFLRREKPTNPVMAWLTREYGESPADQGFKTGWRR